MFLFWNKSVADRMDDTVPGRVATEAEGLFRSGGMHCAEAVLASVRNEFAPGVEDQVVHLAAGFGGGSGSGCICGAVSGGTMALGLVLADRKRSSSLTRKLHEWFKSEYGATCCKILSANGKSGCAGITASVAGKVAEMLQEAK